MQVASSQNKDEAKTRKAGLPVSITVKSRGFPRANFEDGKDLPSTGAGNQSPVSQKLLTSADFDSDGTADLITVDISGTIRFYRGNVDSIYPNSTEAAARKATATFTDAAFFQNSKIAILPISPDYFESGDFNADGYQDIVAAGTGGNSLYFLAGNGRGNLSQPNEIALDGSITSLTSGEIGRPDGQTDVAVVTGSKLLLFERPEGAFSGPPETIKLKAPADIIVVGQLNDDGFGDVVTAGGSRLTIVYGRGKASPWDKIEGSGIVRPIPTTDSVSMPFRIAGLEIGYFTEKRGQSLAVLTSGGEIRTLASPVAAPKPGAFKASQIGELTGPVPKADTRSFKEYRKYVESVVPVTDEIDALGLYEAVPPGTTSLEKHLADQNKKRAEALGKLSPDERVARQTGEKVEADDAKRRTREGFLRAISPAGSELLSRWTVRTMAQDPRLASSAGSFSKTKLIKVRVSDSGRDELAFLDTASSQIHLLIHENPKRGVNRPHAEIVSLDSASTPIALIPMRLNADAVSDLVVLREGAETPSVVMTAPSATFVVTTVDDEDDGSCGSSCSLREAIDAANSSVGVDTISFSIGTGTQTLAPLTDLPTIEFGVTIDGTTQPGFGGIPLIEINGDSGEDGDNGLSVNAANCSIRGLAANEFRRDRTRSGWTEYWRIRHHHF